MLTAATVAWAAITIGGVKMRDDGVSDGDFLSWASTATGDNLTSIEGSVRDVVGSVPSTLMPEPELDRRQLSHRDAGESL